MTGPQGPAAAGGDRLRAGQADREQAIEVLKAAFVQGRLTRDELDARAGQAFAARTYAELAALTTDLPAGLAGAQAPKPAWVQPPPPSVKDGKAAARMIATATAIPAGLWAFVIFAPDRYTDNGGSVLLVGSSTIIWLIVLLLVWADMHISRQQRRSGGRSPRRPAAGAGGQAPQRLPSAGPDRQLPPADHGHRHTAEAASSRRPRTLLPGWRARISIPCVR